MALTKVNSILVDGAINTDASGNVGIGTSSPEFQLHVSGANPRLQLTDTDTGADSYVSAASSNGSLVIGADENNEVASSVMSFRVDGTERMRINTSGNLLVGTTSPGTMSASSQPVVVRSGATGIINARNDNVANNGTLDITVSSGGAGFAGLLVVQNTNLGTANARTQATFSVLGRGTDAAATQIATRNGTNGGQTFSITFPSAGVIRITNTSGSLTSITASFFGNEGF